MNKFAVSMNLVAPPLGTCIAGKFWVATCQFLVLALAVYLLTRDVTVLALLLGAVTWMWAIASAATARREPEPLSDQITAVRDLIRSLRET